MDVTSTLCCIPQEVLEHIAFHLGSESFLGPPSSIPALLLTCHQLHSQLSFDGNHHLYARIFCSKFDTAAAQSRLDVGRLTSKPLAEELKKRCTFLKRLKGRLDSTVGAHHQREGSREISVRDTLFTAYVMVLENEGKNVAQLEEFGKIRLWIREFWFDIRGSSLAVYNIQTGNWPLMCVETALGMWLLWFFLSPEEYTSDNSPESPLSVIKAIAVGEHVFNLTTLGWAESNSDDNLYTITLYGEKIACRAPPLAVPAILSYFTLSLPPGRLVPQTPRFASLPHPSWQEWELEWSRSFPRVGHLTDHFRAGSMEGAWEGFFIYPEFEAYASLLAGAPPSVAQKCLVGRHQQTWKLREYHLIATDGGLGSSFDINSKSEGEVDMPPAGSPLRAYFPPGANVQETKDGLIMTRADSSKKIKYTRYSKSRHLKTFQIRDIILVGEGHSAWGQFNILGRVRPYDGFVTLLKDYANGARGQWLYRAYLVGNSNGNLAGRWRDTWTPLDHQGYEGCFIMSRRR
ncbi:hypothetical protein CPB83DRAFT_853333 [Crepidotus variabilis]|uniref:F-box domain-containing protein n=1 Tax=Crepidotus variabilis TaxID=179855 RepID=A0A9P6JQT0_9AGAR|nr:hypothetical protein CPB83DRAFT_853333 [Crepidotus variabilis]